jgi:hypothetical protein
LVARKIDSGVQGASQLRLAAGLDRVHRVEDRGIDGDAQHQRRLADRLGAVSGAR